MGPGLCFIRLGTPAEAGVQFHGTIAAPRHLNSGFHRNDG